MLLTAHEIIHREKPITLSLEALAQRLRVSDEVAFAELFQRLHAPMIRYVRQLTASEATAYDVLQDVFLRLWERRLTLTIEISVKAFLYTMARNRALNIKRHEAWVAADTDVTVAQERQGHVAASDQQLEADDLQVHVQHWIDTMPPRRGEAFVLSRYHGLKHREISAIMGLTERTVQTHILHALRDLRRHLAQLQNREKL